LKPEGLELLPAPSALPLLNREVLLPGLRVTSMRLRGVCLYLQRLLKKPRDTAEERLPGSLWDNREELLKVSEQTSGRGKQPNER
tara:strand:- start:1683 stop:1937 length:255 start_codon:yes stop_codon:yes gene_type:complete